MKTSQYFVLRPWYIKPPNIVFDLVHLKKDHTNALVYGLHFLEIKNIFCDFIQVYTDGAHDANSIASPTVFPSETISKRSHNLASIFTAEAQAIIDVLHKIKHLHASKFFLFFQTHFHVLLYWLYIPILAIHS